MGPTMGLQIKIAALLKYGKLHTLVSVVNTGTNYETQCCTSMGSTVTQQWYRCHGTKLNPSWSPLTGANFASTPEV
jgi:hypothetical protein